MTLRHRKLAVTVSALAMLVAQSCVGVFSSAPPDNVEFASVTDLHQLDGRYRNRGEGAPDAQWPTFLSALIFPGDAALDHEAIEFVDVRATGASTMTARALDVQGLLVKESSFVSGRDFVLYEGRLRIKSEGALLSQGGDDPLLGPRRDEIDLGIDRRGHGKSSHSSWGAGLVYLFLPVVLGGSDQVRFERIAD